MSRAAAIPATRVTSRQERRRPHTTFRRTEHLPEHDEGVTRQQHKRRRPIQHKPPFPQRPRPLREAERRCAGERLWRGRGRCCRRGLARRLARLSTPHARRTHAHRDAQRDSGAHVYNTMLLGTSRTSPGAVTARGDGRQTSSHHKTQKGAMPPMTPSTPPHCPALAAARSAAPA